MLVPPQCVTQCYVEHAEGLEHPSIDEHAGIDGVESKSLGKPTHAFLRQAPEASLRQDPL